MRNRVKAGMAALMVGFVLVCGGVEQAQACDPCCKYVKVVTYQTKIEPYIKWVTLVDEEGCKYRVKKVYYRKVQKPVVKWVKVCH